VKFSFGSSSNSFVGFEVTGTAITRSCIFGINFNFILGNTVNVILVLIIQISAFMGIRYVIFVPNSLDIALSAH
jgi:hypothetical protein